MHLFDCEDFKVRMLRNQGGLILFMFSAISMVHEFKPLFQNPKTQGPGVMAQHLGAHVALTEDQCSVPSTHMSAHNSL